MILRFRTCFTASILALSLTAGTVFNPATVVQTRPPKLSQSQAGFYRLKVGDIEVIALSDGTVPLPTLEVLTNAQPGEVERLLTAAFQKPLLNASVNAYLIVADSRLVLVDAGAGELYGPTLNKLPASLEAAGYKPEQITDILITHIHTDHSGGLMDGDRQVFPNATIHVDKREIDFWLSPANLKAAEVGRQKYFREAVAKAAAGQRRRAYADAAKSGYLVAPAHVSFPGIGHLRPEGSGYRWIPIPYINDAYRAK